MPQVTGQHEQRYRGNRHSPVERWEARRADPDQQSTPRDVGYALYQLRSIDVLRGGLQAGLYYRYRENGKDSRQHRTRDHERTPPCEDRFVTFVLRSRVGLQLLEAIFQVIAGPCRESYS